MADTYTNSQIILYQIDGLKPSLNAYIDDLSNYLAGQPQLVLNCQYIKQDLDISVKLNIPQNNLLNFKYNYCSIMNRFKAGVGFNKDKVCYYYIMDLEWISENTIKLKLGLDTVNTLGQGNTSLGNPRNFLNNTHITREHKDRFYNKKIDGKYLRRIDRFSEELNPPLIKKSDITLTDDSDNRNLNWYLVYSSTDTDTNKRIKLNVYPNKSGYKYSIGDNTDTKEFTFSDLEANKYYYFLLDDNIDGKFKIGDGSIITLGGEVKRTKKVRFTVNGIRVDELVSDTLVGLVLTRDITTATIKYTYIYNDMGYWMESTDTNPSLGYYENTTTDKVLTTDSITYLNNQPSGLWSYSDTITFTNASIFRVSNNNYVSENSSINTLYSIRDIDVIGVGSTTNLSLTTIDSVDKTDSNLIKIIECPYCPVPHKMISSNVYSFSEALQSYGWEYDNGSLSTSIQYNINPLSNTTFNIKSSFSDDVLLSIVSTSPLLYKNKTYESKLYCSEFYSDKYLYDSFYKDIKLENITYDFTQQEFSTSDFNLNWMYLPSNTITSSSVFKKSFGVPTISILNSDDYDDYLVYKRNNEVAIFNDSYIEYIKNGYNYDQKTNALTIKQNKESVGINALMGAAGGAVSGVMIGKTVGSAAGAVGIAAGAVIGSVLGSVIGGGMALLTGGVSTSQLREQQELSMESKLYQLSKQSASVDGSDDLNLLNIYNGNKLHRIKYNIDPLFEDRVFNYLYLYGYNTNEYKVPDVDSRVWFNYIKCEPVLDTEGLTNLRETWVDDLKLRYNSGVTVFHKYNNTYDFKQQYENWESWMISE